MRPPFNESRKQDHLANRISSVSLTSQHSAIVATFHSRSPFGYRKDGLGKSGSAAGLPRSVDRQKSETPER
jgi:hypothetical protein